MAPRLEGAGFSRFAHSSLNIQDFLFAIDAEGVPADKVTVGWRVDGGST